MSVGAKVDKGCFEAWLDAGYLGFVNVGFGRDPGAVFNIKIV